MQHPGLCEEMKPRLLERHEPAVGHREGRGALAGVMKPVPVLQRPVLLEPVRGLGFDKLRQWRRHEVTEDAGQHWLELIRKAQRQDAKDEQRGD
ncbi:hypothetical protein ABIF90_004563 [Bradyrhizobium japonicum]